MEHGPLIESSIEQFVNLRKQQLGRSLIPNLNKNLMVKNQI
jgi:hypothetical protein